MLISHDLGIVAGTAERVAVMYAGRIVERGAVEGIFDSPRHPYTRGLLASLPKIDGQATRLTSIEGSPPSLAARPPGCAFHPRCRHAVARCTTDEPTLRDVAGAAVACHLAESIADAALAPVTADGHPSHPNPRHERAVCAPAEASRSCRCAIW